MSCPALRRGGCFQRYWLPRLVAGDVGVQICPLYGEGARRRDARARTLAQEAEFRRAVEDNAEHVCHLQTRADLGRPALTSRAVDGGRRAAEGDPHAFEEWHARGVHTASLTWNHANAFAGGIDTPTQGLTDRGRALVRRFRELGVILDLAHASEQTWRDGLKEEIPFSVTHACCRAIHDHPRNLADWQLEGLAERGGVLGMMALPFVVDPDAPTVSRWLDHFDHAVAVMGIEHRPRRRPRRSGRAHRAGARARRGTADRRQVTPQTRGLDRPRGLSPARSRAPRTRLRRPAARGCSAGTG
jgi:membrane dipeptidase